MKRMASCSIALGVATFLSLATPVAGWAAEQYAVVALIGDELTIVTYQPSVGSNLDGNARQVVPLRDTSFDEVALRAVERSLPSAARGAEAILLEASDRNLYARGPALTVAGEGLTSLLNTLGHDFPDVDARYLILVSKARGDMRLMFDNGASGEGKLGGLGIYVDRLRRVTDRSSGEESKGFVSAFAYLTVSLIDRRTGAVVRSHTGSETTIIPSGVSKTTMNAWDAVPAQMKVDAVNTAIRRLIETTVPLVLAPT